MQYPNDLAPLDELDDWKIADYEIDPRGMTLIGRGGENLGEIKTLLASPSAEEAFFAIVEPAAHRGQHFAVPLENIRFDADNRRAYAPYLAANFAQAPQYSAGARDYDAYNSYWLGVLEREPVAEADRHEHEQHRPAKDALRLHREVLKADKEVVEAGEVTVRTEVVEETKTLEVPVKREEVVITRHPVEGGRIETGGIEASEEEIRIPIRQEEVHVSKNTVVTEEVEIGKREVQETQTVSETLRHEEAHIDTTGKARVIDTDVDKS